jgi:hypothetical protein
MEENELEEVVAETTEEETVEEEANENSPTLEDYERLKKEKETLLAQKEHWRKKAETIVKPKETLKTNETQSSSLSREEAILFAKGYTEDEVDLANKLAKVNGIGVLEAIEDDYLKSKRALRLKKEKSEMASLPASNGTGKFKADKPVGEMTEEEHRAYFNKVMGN